MSHITSNEPDCVAQEHEAEDAFALKPEPPQAHAPWRQGFRVLRLIRNDTWALPAVLFFGVAAALAEGIGLSFFIPLIRALSGADINETFGPFAAQMSWIPQQHLAAVIVSFIVAAIIAKNVILYGNEVVTQYVKGKVCHRLRIEAFSQTLSSCADYAQGERQGQIANIIASETWRVGDALFHVLRMLIAIVICALLSVLMFYISWQLSTAALVGLVTVIIAVNVLSSYARAVGKSTVDANRAFGQRLWERIHALKLIRSFGQEARETEAFAARSGETRRQMFRISLMWTMPGHIAEILSAVLVAVLILLAVAYSVDLAVLLAFLAVFYRLQHPAREIVSNMVAVASLSGSAEAVLDYIEKTREPYIAPGMEPFEVLNTAIEFRSVDFSYPGTDETVLKDVSFTIPRGKMTALVGESGAGKSTLIDLLFRFHDPDDGEVLVDGFSLTHLDAGQWRSRLSLMSQDVRLFDATVHDNITYGLHNADEGDVERAAHVADAHEFISTLPEGYETVLGDDGAHLSGGQRQRIALARTVLRNPEILLLDEPTNALDSVSEAAFQRSLETYMRGKTVLVVAHRLSTIRHADNIVVLSKGRVVEQGTYDDLMQQKGTFARLHETQFIGLGGETEG